MQAHHFFYWMIYMPLHISSDELLYWYHEQQNAKLTINDVLRK